MNKKDDEIIHAVQTGKNEQVLNHLYKHEFPKIKRYILKNKGSVEDASDIFQDTVIVLYEQIKLGKFNDSYDIGGFLYTVARNTWINKKKKRTLPTESIEDSHYYLYDEAGDALGEWINREEEEKVKNWLLKLGEPCRSLLIDTIFHNMRLKAVCKKYDIESEDALKAKTYRCRKKLAMIIKENKSE